MLTRVFALLVTTAVLSATARGDERIRVLPMPGGAATFAFGDICNFETSTTPLPDEPLRVRIIRGTRDSLKRWGSSAMNIRNACVEYYSIIVRPRSRSTERLDLNIFVGPGWLEGESDGHFTFILEADDNPSGPRIEYRKLRLAPELVDEYFNAGKEVTVRAPAQRIALTSSGGSRSMYAGGAGIECVNLQWDPRRVLIREAMAQPDNHGEGVAGSH